MSNLYETHPETYAELVSYEDPEGSLLTALREIHPLEGVTVLECGAGTGRVTRQIAPLAGRLLSTDLTHAMLRAGGVRGAVADMRALPVRTAWADVVVEGWAVLQMLTWAGAAWEAALDAALAEMRRALKPGGTLILIETLGTGHEQPDWRYKGFGRFYEAFAARGFEATWVRTDFVFPDAAEAERLMRFFFGDELEAFNGQRTIPECTGLWWRRM